MPMRKQHVHNLWREQHDLLWRAPDKPVRATLRNIPSIERTGSYVAQPKIDGHRAMIEIDDTCIRAISRHNKPLPVDPKILGQIRSLGLPSGTMLDAEWTGRRALARGATEALWLLDVMFLAWEWQGAKSLYERLEPIAGLDLPEDVRRVETVSRDFLGLLERQIGDPVSEGIVLKKVSATLVGRAHESALNRGWQKVKWRDGPSGEDVVITKEDVRRLMVLE